MRAVITTTIDQAATLRLTSSVRVTAHAIVTGLDAQMVAVGSMGDPDAALPGDRAEVELQVDLNTLRFEVMT